MVIVFICSFCTLVIEVIAAHILAPFVGRSLYTWTSIIGVVLGALSLGAYLGGRLADKAYAGRVLGLIVFGSGAVASLVFPIAKFLQTFPFWTGVIETLLQLSIRLTLLATLLFFLPCALLGMVSPIVTKLTISDMSHSGKKVGQVSAVGTFGSIVGTFLTGFVLISYFSTQQILLMTAVLLIGTALALPEARTEIRNRPRLGLILFGILVISVFLNLTVRRQDAVAQAESAYSSILVEDSVRADTGTPARRLILDRGFHTESDLSDPLYLRFPYLRMVTQYLEVSREREAPLKALVLGGGGFSLPRYLEATYPKAEIDVVEIDPVVIRMAYNHLGLKKSDRIRVHNQDARWFVMTEQNRKKYDVIFVDTFFSSDIPYHLVSLEYLQSVKNLLSPTGVILTNVIDSKNSYGFWSSYALTLSQAFKKSGVAVIYEPEWMTSKALGNIVIVGTEHEAQLASALDQIQKQTSGTNEPFLALSGGLLFETIRNQKGIVLTDAYNPSETMMLKHSIDY